MLCQALRLGAEGSRQAWPKLSPARGLWNTFGHMRSRIAWLDTANRQAEETNDRARMAAHVGLRAVGCLVDERKALQN